MSFTEYLENWKLEANLNKRFNLNNKFSLNNKFITPDLLRRKIF
jgi:acetone carboxylase gamma subunit